jgi:hypothetical protein
MDLESKDNYQGFRTNQIFHLVLIWVIIAVIIIYDFTLKQEWNDTLSFMSILIAVGTLIFTILYEKFKTDNELKDRITRSLETLQNDIKYNIEEGFEIKDEKFTKRECKYKKDDTKAIHITYIQIGTEVYDSILSSGLFSYFQKESQLVLGDFYFNVKLHNRQLSEIRRFEFEHRLGYGTKDKSDYEEVNVELEQRLTEYENDIKHLFLKLKHYLKGEFTRVEDSKFFIPEYTIPKDVIPEYTPSGKA